MPVRTSTTGDCMERASFVVGAVALAFIHFMLSFFAASYAGMTSNRVAGAIATVLLFPLSVLPESVETSPAVGWALWAGLSLLWGVGIGLLIRRYAR